MVDIPVGRSLNDDEVAAYVADALLDSRSYQPQLGPTAGEVFARLSLALPDSWNVDNRDFDDRVTELLWRWVVLGLAVPKGPNFLPTTRGRPLLEAGEERRLLAPNGMLSTLRERCPELDDITLQYATLAHEAFHATLFEASVILLGIAAEVLVLRVSESVETIASSLRLPRPVLISKPAAKRLDGLRDWIETNWTELAPRFTSAGIDARDFSELPRHLSYANTTRLSRNDVGHPTRVIARRDEAFGQLAQFPSFCELLTRFQVAVVELAAGRA